MSAAETTTAVITEFCSQQLGKGVAAGSCEHPSWARPEGLTMAGDEVHANG